jgi:hypothetical protein
MIRKLRETVAIAAVSRMWLFYLEWKIAQSLKEKEMPLFPGFI